MSIKSVKLIILIRPIASVDDMVFDRDSVAVFTVKCSIATRSCVVSVSMKAFNVTRNKDHITPVFVSGCFIAIL